MALWYTINGLSGTPRKEIVTFIEAHFLKKGNKVVSTADPKGTKYGQLANDIIVEHHVAVSAFTEALLYLTCSKEAFDHIDWNGYDIVISRGSFLETFGYQNQLCAWNLEDAKQMITLFRSQMHAQLPKLSIVLTEYYEAAAKRAGEGFEYKDKEIKYKQDSNRFLQIQNHPIVKPLNMDIVAVEVNGRDPWEVFQQEIEPIL